MYMHTAFLKNRYSKNEDLGLLLLQKCCSLKPTLSLIPSPLSLSPLIPFHPLRTPKHSCGGGGRFMDPIGVLKLFG